MNTCKDVTILGGKNEKKRFDLKMNWVLTFSFPQEYSEERLNVIGVVTNV